MRYINYGYFIDKPDGFRYICVPGSDKRFYRFKIEDFEDTNNHSVDESRLQDETNIPQQSKKYVEELRIVCSIQDCIRDSVYGDLCGYNITHDECKRLCEDIFNQLQDYAKQYTSLVYTQFKQQLDKYVDTRKSYINTLKNYKDLSCISSEQYTRALLCGALASNNCLLSVLKDLDINIQE